MDIYRKVITVTKMGKLVTFLDAINLLYSDQITAFDFTVCYISL